MEQLTQKLGSGEMVIQELPVPQLSAGMILVKNHYSLISAGTEGSTVKAARKSLIGKAKECPQQVKQVLEKLRQQGLAQTYRAVMKKHDAYSPLGYSLAGEVIAVASDVAPRPKRAMVYSHVAGDQALYEAVIHVFEEMKSTKSESSNINYGYYDEIVNVYDSLLNKDSI